MSELEIVVEALEKMTALVDKTEKERDEAQKALADLQGDDDAWRRTYERTHADLLAAEADAARLREALRETLEVVEGETCGECGVKCEACECDGSAWWRRARAALAGEQETNKDEP